MRGGVLVAFVAGIAFSQDVDIQPDPHVEASPLSGNVRVWRSSSGKVQALRNPDQVAPDDRLGTAQAARVWVNGQWIVSVKTVSPGKSSGVSLTKKGSKLIVNVARCGAALESFGAEAELKTKHTLVNTKSGYVAVESSEDKDVICTLDGEAEVSNEQGKAKVPAGQTVVVAKGKAPEAPKATAMPVLAWSAQMCGLASVFPNGSFEQGLTGWSLSSAKGVKSHLDERVAFAGRKSLRVDFEQFRPDVNFPFPARPVQVKKGQHYLLQVYVMMKNYKVSGQAGKIGLSVAFDVAHTDVAKSEPVACEGGWRCLRLAFTAKESDTIIGIRWQDGTHDGSVWIDAWALTLLPALPK